MANWATKLQRGFFLTGSKCYRLLLKSVKLVYDLVSIGVIATAIICLLPIVLITEILNSMESSHQKLKNGVTRKKSFGFQKVGILVRLHVLGDFFSEEYVKFWWKQLFWNPKLYIFGYTAAEGKILEAIQISLNGHPRSVIRQSRPHSYDGRNRFAAASKYADRVNGFWCPEQRGTVASCADCGLCWSAKKTVIFEDH